MPSAPPDPDAFAHRCAVLAGGAGSRLGGGKPRAALAGRPLIDHVLGAARRAGLAITVVTKPGASLSGTDAERDDIELLVEPEEPRHPLLGVATALNAAAEALVVAPCDTPLIPASLLAHLASCPGETVVISAAGRLEPLLGRYPVDAAGPLMEAALAGRAAHDAVAELGPRVLTEEDLRPFGDPQRLLENVNTPEDLARIEMRLHGR